MRGAKVTSYRLLHGWHLCGLQIPLHDGAGVSQGRIGLEAGGGHVRLSCIHAKALRGVHASTFGRISKLCNSVHMRVCRCVDGAQLCGPAALTKYSAFERQAEARDFQV